MFEESLQTSETRIKKLGVPNNLQRLVYGGTNQTFNLDESYQPAYNYTIGSFIESTRLSEDSFYYLASASDANMYLFY